MRGYRIFFREVPYLIFFLVDKGIKDTITTINGPPPAICWRPDSDLTLNAVSVGL